MLECWNNCPLLTCGGNASKSCRIAGASVLRRQLVWTHAASTIKTLRMFSFDYDKFSNDRLTLVAPIKNEMFFLPSFLDHYRKLGVEQFCFIDDHSDDGSAGYIQQQKDCVLVRSKYKFGQRLWLRPDITGFRQWGLRAGAAWKNWFPRRYLKGRWCIYADLDEYLLLPPGFPTVQAFLKVLDEKAIAAVPAVMVDFYPQSTADLAEPLEAKSLSDLLDRYSFYDSKPYVKWTEGDTVPSDLGQSVTGRLLDRMLDDVADNGTAQAFEHQPNVALKITCKVPIVKWLDGVAYRGSHRLNSAPSTEYMLPILHFKYTQSVYSKIAYAVKTNSYAGNSNYYRTLVLVLRYLDENDGLITGSVSKKFATENGFYKDFQANVKN